MPKAKVRVLLIDGVSDAKLQIRKQLAETQFVLETCRGYTAGLKAINSEQHDVYLVDFHLGTMTGLELLSACHIHERAQPFIILTDKDNELIEREAMKLGVDDYLIKDSFDAELLTRVILHSLQRRQMEFQRAQELMEVSKSKDEFIALASHQLRTPATGVKQYVGMLLEGYAGSLTAEQTALLQSAYSSNERQLHIVNDILRVAQVDLNRINIRQKPTELGKLLDDILAEQQVEFSSRDQLLQYHKPKGPIRATLDTDHFRMAVGNIISNAAKYTPDGKKITVRLGKTKKQAYVAVTDEGVGISTLDQAKLFQKFSRIDNPLSVQAGGSGLGLYLANKIIEQHGGSITVESQPDNGTTFTITVPAA
jgi:signal transduction histidine kinase